MTRSPSWPTPYAVAALGLSRRSLFDRCLVAGADLLLGLLLAFLGGLAFGFLPFMAFFLIFPENPALARIAFFVPGLAAFFVLLKQAVDNAGESFNRRYW
jgi:uncharacterized membrane protein YuzA (DUF378 family)